MTSTPGAVVEGVPAPSSHQHNIAESLSKKRSHINIPTKCRQQGANISSLQAGHLRQLSLDRLVLLRPSSSSGRLSNNNFASADNLILEADDAIEISNFGVGDESESAARTMTSTECKSYVHCTWSLPALMKLILISFSAKLR
jgi:hypothetical protein